MSAVRCSKCGAGMGALYRRVDFLECGQEIEAVACKICSQILAERLKVHRAPSPSDRDEDGECVKVRQLPVCEVEGCGRTYYSKGHARPWCSDHRNAMKEWERSRRKTPAPLIDVNGTWIDNPERFKRAPTMTSNGG